MLKIFVQRFLQLIAVLWGVSSIVFFLQRMIPGSPADTILGVDASDADKVAWLTLYGFQDPLWKQYFNFIIQLCQGDLGRSYSGYISVTEIIMPRLWETIQLATVAFIFSILLASLEALSPSMSNIRFSLTGEI